MFAIAKTPERRSPPACVQTAAVDRPCQRCHRHEERMHLPIFIRGRLLRRLLSVLFADRAAATARTAAGAAVAGGAGGAAGATNGAGIELRRFGFREPEFRLVLRLAAGSRRAQQAGTR